MLPWEVWTYDEDPEKNEWHPEPPVATDVEWDRWDNANLHSLLLKLNRAAEVPDDIDLTAFVPAKFRPLQNDPANPENHNQQFDFLENVPILGVDVNVIEGWDIDEHDPFGSVWIEGPAPPPENDDYVVFYAEGIDADSDGTIVNAGEIVETHIEGNLLDKDIEGDAEHGYREIIEELSCWEGSWCVSVHGF